MWLQQGGGREEVLARCRLASWGGPATSMLGEGGKAWSDGGNMGREGIEVRIKDEHGEERQERKGLRRSGAARLVCGLDFAHVGGGSIHQRRF